MRTKLFILLMGVTILVHAAPSEQVTFSRTIENGDVQFNYQWHDHQNNAQSIAFSLTAENMNQLPNQQANYRPRMAMRYVTTELLKHAKTVDPRQARISIRQMGEEIDVGVRSQDARLVSQLRAEFMDKKEQAFAKYLYDHYYMSFKTSYGQDAIKPDHARYVQVYTEALIPASQAFYEKLGQGTDARDYINLLLSWIQSIPYSELSNRSESNGSGFSPPVELLNANRGDCDSKSVLAAAMIRAFLPTVPIRLVLLPKHALLGVAISQANGDEIINENGLQLVLMEPTGPAPFAFGEISETSRADIARDLYVLEEVP
ncbi:hypothetical protein DRW07_14570 [Alteromonas sediminis]|uniref:Transglutaminase domain-containing protein n=1 Tax=Alteromonas sediminis TaxID=2259342 RepID=A0A3N5Y0J8_9ALTE|nr:hypothetical protein [Alteromonas sediminis]RPJ66026.1 hypothetical protein DRW07_14570 [Alteromonas sediminis]